MYTHYNKRVLHHRTYTDEKETIGVGPLYQQKKRFTVDIFSETNFDGREPLVKHINLSVKCRKKKKKKNFGTKTISNDGGFRI